MTNFQIWVLALLGAILVVLVWGLRCLASVEDVARGIAGKLFDLNLSITSEIKARKRVSDITT